MGGIGVVMAALDISQLRFMIVEDNPFMQRVLKQWG